MSAYVIEYLDGSTERIEDVDSTSLDRNSAVMTFYRRRPMLGGTDFIKAVVLANVKAWTVEDR